MLRAISVSKYNAYIKQIFDAEELLHNINIIGEVFGVSFSRQVIYFSLKDETSSISCVCFYPQLTNIINEGDMVVITGSPNYYTKAGKLSFNVVNVQKAGVGLLYQKFIEMKDKLEKEGLFDESHKISLPKKIKRIGVITSKDGAVIHDIINVSTRRDKSVDIVLYPTKVQGNGAEDEIAFAIQSLDNYNKIDVIVVARGGGSLEDLWAYNTEKVARAIYNCQKPIVSAIGHETDFTIADFVSDLRAPTPSAAAELLTTNVSDKNKNLINQIERLYSSISNYYFQKETQKNSLITNILSSFDKNFTENEFKLHKKALIIEKNIEHYSNDFSYQLDMLQNSLDKLSPYEILKRGYAKIEQNKKPVDNLKDLVLSSDLEINFYDGKVTAKPIKMEERKWIMKTK